MEEKEHISPEESLNLIEKTIQRARGKFSDVSIYFILWGWLVFSVCLLHFIFHRTGFDEYASHLWMLMPIGGILSGYIGYKQGKKTTAVKTFIDKYIMAVWTGFFFALVITLYIMIDVDISFGYFLLILCMAWATWTTGHILDFSIMRWSGVIGFGISVISLFVSFPAKQLVLAIAMLVIYILPGHILKKHIKNHNLSPRT